MVQFEVVELVAAAGTALAGRKIANFLNFCYVKAWARARDRSLSFSVFNFSARVDKSSVNNQRLDVSRTVDRQLVHVVDENCRCR